MAAALLASGCGKFVRDELIYMQQEIDAIYDQVEQMNKGVATLKTVVTEMADNGYIVSVDEYQDEEKGGYTLKFKSVHLDENGSIVSEDSYSVTLYSGVDAKAAGDFSFIISIPAILGAFILELKDLGEVSSSIGAAPVIAGCAAAFATGYISLTLHMKVIRKGKLHWFAAYLIPVGILGLLFLK